MAFKGKAVDSKVSDHVLGFIQSVVASLWTVSVDRQWEWCAITINNGLSVICLRQYSSLFTCCNKAAGQVSADIVAACLLTYSAHPSPCSLVACNTVGLHAQLQVGICSCCVTWKICGFDKWQPVNDHPVSSFSTSPDRAVQPAAVSGHILLSFLHDRERLLRCLQVRVPHTHAQTLNGKVHYHTLTNECFLIYNSPAQTPPTLPLQCSVYLYKSASVVEPPDKNELSK